MSGLRNMFSSDLSQVNLILSKSFTHARLQSGYKSGTTPLCRREFLEMYLAGNPDGSFVIEKEDKIIAYCFSRLWGTVGWIGPLSVIPAEQGKGYGKKVVSASVDMLKMQGAETIGLEMPAHSNRNLAFYTKLGFVPGKLTVDFVSKVPERISSDPEDRVVLTRYSELSAGKAENFLEEVKQFSRKSEPGLDYAQEIQLTTEFGFGEGCLLSLSGNTIGFVLAHTERYSQEEERRFLKVNALQMASDLPISALNDFLCELEEWARLEKLPGIYIRIPTRYSKVYDFIVERNFTIVNSDLRMTLRGFGQRDNPNDVNISKWE